MSRHVRPRGARRLRAWLFSAAFLYATYLAFAGELSAVELVAGAAVTILATVAAAALGLSGTVRVQPTARDVLQAWRLPYYVVQGTIELLQGLARQLFRRRGAPSLVRAVAFSAVENDPRATARRTLAETYTNMTPNFLVLGVVGRQRLLLYHQVIPSAVLQMTINLGARP